METFNILVPDEFSFELSVGFLQRSPKELLHIVADNHVSKVIQIGAKNIVFELACKRSNQLQVNVLSGLPLQKSEKGLLILFIKEW